MAKPPMLLLIVVSFASASLGCAVTRTGATAEDLGRAHDQAAQGATLYGAQCARCHGQRGEGLGSAPEILGPGALPEYPRNSGTAGDPTITDPQLIQIQAQTRPAGAAWRDAFRNAQDLHAFTVMHMAKVRTGEPKETDYWPIVNYILAAQGVSVPPGGIGPANAASIPIPKR